MRASGANAVVGKQEQKKKRVNRIARIWVARNTGFHYTMYMHVDLCRHYYFGVRAVALTH